MVLCTTEQLIDMSHTFIEDSFRNERVLNILSDEILYKQAATALRAVTA